jgi:RNA polymerase sigma factor (sigma-70 family)
MYHEGAESGRTRAGAHPCAGSSPWRLDPSEELAMRRRLRRWARWKLGIPCAEFDDAYQCAWRKLLEAERRGRRTYNLEHALRWAIHNAWLEECRRRRRRPATSLESVPEAALAYAAAPDPCAVAERREAARYLFEAVGTLTERQQRILVLREVCKLKPEEVCQRLGITRRTYRHEHALALRSVLSRVHELLNGEWCAQHRDMLVAYAERRATAAQTHAAQRHVRNCRACQRRVAVIRCAARAMPPEVALAVS